MWKGSIEGDIPVKGIKTWREDGTLVYNRTINGLNNTTVNTGLVGFIVKNIEPNALLELTNNPSYANTILKIDNRMFPVTLRVSSGRLIAPDLYQITTEFIKAKKTAFRVSESLVETDDRWKYLIVEDFDTDGDWTGTISSGTVESSGTSAQSQVITWEWIEGSWDFNATYYITGAQSIASATDWVNNSIVGGWYHWKDYEFSVWTYIDDNVTDDDPGIYFRYIDSNNFYRLRKSSGTQITLEKVINGSTTTLFVYSSFTFELHTWYQWKVRVQGPQIDCYFNDELIISLKDHDIPSGRIGLYAYKDNIYFDDARVTALPSSVIALPSDVEWHNGLEVGKINSAYGNLRMITNPDEEVEFKLGASDDCVLWFAMDEDSGEILYDKSKNKTHGRIHGATWVEDKDKGWCLEFDSNNNDYVILGNNNLNLGADDIGTIHIEFMITEGSKSNTIFSTADDSFNIHTNSSDQLRFSFKDGSGSVKYWTYGVIELNKWYDVKIIFDETHVTFNVNDDIKPIWVEFNGNYKNTTSYDAVLGANAYWLYVNGPGGGGTGHLDGRIKTVRVFNVLRWDVFYGFDGTPAGVFVWDDNRYERSISIDEYCILLMHMDDGTGTATYDASGKSHDGTLVNGATWVTKSYLRGANTCIHLDKSSTQYININDSTDFSYVGDSPFSVSVWINCDTVSGSERIIISKYQITGDNREWAFFFSGSTDDLYFGCYHNDASAYIRRRTNGYSFVAGQWYHVVATYDGSGSSDGMKIYINGLRADELDSSLGTYTGMTNTLSNLTIGSLHGGGSSFDGYIDDVRLYYRELSQEDVEDLFKSSEHYISTLERVYSTEHNFKGFPIISNGLVMLKFPDIDLYEQRTYNVMLPTIYFWYNNAWHIHGMLSPYSYLAQNASYVTANATQCSFEIISLTDQECTICIKYYIYKDRYPDNNIYDIYLTIRNGFQGIIYQGPDHIDVEMNDRMGFLLYTFTTYGLGLKDKFLLLPNDIVKVGKFDTYFGLSSSTVDSNWFVMIQDYAEIGDNAYCVRGLVSDGYYDSYGGGTQWYISKNQDWYGMYYAHQTKQGAVFLTECLDEINIESEDSSNCTYEGTSTEVVDANASGGSFMEIYDNGTPGAVKANFGTGHRGVYAAVWRYKSATSGSYYATPVLRIYLDSTEIYQYSVGVMSDTAYHTHVAYFYVGDKSQTVYIKISQGPGSARHTGSDCMLMVPISNGYSYPADLAKLGLNNIKLERVWH